MQLAGLIPAALRDRGLARARDLARKGGVDSDALDLTAPASLRPFVVAAVAGAGRRPAAPAGPVLAVTATSREADDLAAALGCLIAADQVAVYPAWETLPHERLSPRSDTVGRRLAVLRRLAHPGRGRAARGSSSRRSAVGAAAAAQGPRRPRAGRAAHRRRGRAGRGRRAGWPTSPTRGSTWSPSAASSRSAAASSTSSRRPTSTRLRVEFWGDEVEEIRTFAVADQRTIDTVERLWAPPCRELLLTADVRARAAELAEQHPELAEMLDKLAEGIPVEGMESLAPALLDGTDSHGAAARLHAGRHPRAALRPGAHPHPGARPGPHQRGVPARRSWAAAAVGGKAPIDLGAAAFQTLAEVRAHAADAGPAVVDGVARSAWPRPRPSPTTDEPWLEADADASTVAPDTGDAVALPAQPVPLYHGETGRVVDDLKRLAGDGWRVALVFEGHGPAQRAAEVLRDAGLGVRAGRRDRRPRRRRARSLVTTGALEHGFVDEAAPARRHHRQRHLRRPRRVHQGHAQDAEPAAQHHRPAGAAHRRLRRARAARHRPVRRDGAAHGQRRRPRIPGHRVRGVQARPARRPALRARPTRSTSSPATSAASRPTLHKMGGSDWQKAKARARKAVREIAAQLIQLYAARQTLQGPRVRPGHAVAARAGGRLPLHGDARPAGRDRRGQGRHGEAGPDGPADLRRRRLRQDRDRGAGGVQGGAGRQAGGRAGADHAAGPAALQHVLRADEPVPGRDPAAVPVPDARRRPSETHREGRPTARADIVIGTHRLLQTSTRFKQLGLVIVDEEQRFGVEHKEYLKQLRAYVDVLTMSATPIPRTLEMAITGIREMSTIATPPEERHPVLTFVGAQDDKQVAAAIHRELLRDGQVFYLHNRVESIERAARRLRELVPEARVAVAHGQMGEDALEKVMVGFWEKEYDVLVCTTIVESGIDIPNANTLIVERADLLGLAQLHQIRGRVGRGRERAYAYFLYPPEKPLTEHAHERLATIAQHTELGAGMYVAMKDLEIRGAGNLLGGEQSGHIEGVGFDLYVRMVGEAVQQFKGERARRRSADVKIDLPVDAHLPHEYIGVERLRLEMYRKLAEARRRRPARRGRRRDDATATASRRRRSPTCSRWPGSGCWPGRYGLTDVSLQGKHIRFAPLPLPDSKQLRLKRYYPDAVYKAATDQVSVPRPMTRRVGGEPLRDQALLEWCAAAAADVLGEVPAPGAAA